MMALFTVMATMAADPAADQSELLKTFREEFVLISPGNGPFPASFSMGSQQGGGNDSPAHRVTFKGPFYIARYEATQNLYEAVMGVNPSKWKGERNSVEMLSFDDAVEFCKRATGRMRKAGLITANQAVRLPSEAEWEYAARAGTDTAYSFGDAAKDIDAFGWHRGNAKDNDPPVGAKKPNAWKLYDVHGYLWEWCSDAWHDDYQKAPADGSVWAKGGDAKRRVLRGGSWKDNPEKLTSRFRRAVDGTTKDDAVGFRCVLTYDGSKVSD